MIIKLVKTLKIFFILDIKRTYLHGYFVFFELLATYLTVLIYFYSSQAFGPKAEASLNFFGTNLFSFLFWGDILLRIPQNLFYAPISNIKQSINDNTFEPMVLLGGSVKMIITALSSMQILREIFSICMMIICAHFFFGLNINLMNLLKVTILIFTFFPLFLSLGFIVSGFVLYFERGENSLNLISNIMAILAGMYFPTEVFPKFLNSIGHYLSPYAYFLRINREILQTGHINYQTLIFIVATGIFSFFISINFVVYILNKKKSMGRSLIIG